MSDPVMVSLAFNTMILLVTTGAIWIGSGWLESSAEKLSMYYGLPPVIQESIVTPVRSSFPELATVVFYVRNGSDILSEQ